MSSRGSSSLTELQLAASLHPQLQFLSEQSIIDRSRLKQATTPPRKYRIADVKRSCSELDSEIEELQNTMSDDELSMYHHSLSKTQNSEPLDLSILRESIAAAVAGEEEFSSEYEEEITEDFHVTETHQQSEQTFEDTEEDEERRRTMLRLSPHQALDRTLRLEELYSDSPRRSKKTHTSKEYARAHEASEKARQRLYSPFMSSAPKGVTIAERAFHNTQLEATLNHPPSRTATSAYYKRVKDTRTKARGTDLFIETHKQKKKPEPKKEIPAVILPDPPLITQSCHRICGLLNTEIDGILAEADRLLNHV